MQAAILRVNCSVSTTGTRRRQQVASWYDPTCRRRSCARPCPTASPTCTTSTWCARPRRDAIAAALKAREIACASYYVTPLHLQPAFAYLGHKPGDFPVTERAAAENLALPMHPNLTEDQVEAIAGAVASALD